MIFAGRMKTNLIRNFCYSLLKNSYLPVITQVHNVSGISSSSALNIELMVAETVNSYKFESAHKFFDQALVGNTSAYFSAYILPSLEKEIELLYNEAQRITRIRQLLRGFINRALRQCFNLYDPLIIFPKPFHKIYITFLKFDKDSKDHTFMYDYAHKEEGFHDILEKSSFDSLEIANTFSDVEKEAITEIYTTLFAQKLFKI